ncbi:MAG: 5'-deoxyadenosine deaminase [Patescibacteria group bacterium]
MLGGDAATPSVLIENALIVTMNARREVLEGNLLVADDRIQAVGPGAGGDSPAAERIDARGQVLIPGLVQAHVHLCQALFRGQADDLELLDWLRTRIWPLEGAHDEESIYWSALLGIGELFRGGTTSVIDMETVHHTASAFAAIGEAGLRALSGKCLMDHDAGAGVPAALLEDTETALRESLALLENWHGRFGGRLRYAFTPRFAVSCSEGLLRRVGELSRAHGVRIHTHAAESRGETELVERERKMRNVAYLDRLGLATENLILAHCIWLDDEEMGIIREKGVKVAHCPSSNLKLASGTARVAEMLERGIEVALGADGAPCNNNLDQFTEMRTAALVQKLVRGPRALPARQVFELATLGGAAAMGQTAEIGSLEPGKKADLALVDLRKLHCSPLAGGDIYAQLVYQARSADVTLTMVDGRIVYRDGRLTTIDEAGVLREAERQIERVYARAGLAMGGDRSR